MAKIGATFINGGKMKVLGISILTLLLCINAQAISSSNESLLQLKAGHSITELQKTLGANVTIEPLFQNWVLVKSNDQSQSNFSARLKSQLRANLAVKAIQPNFKLHILKNPSLNNPQMKEYLANWQGNHRIKTSRIAKDNPAIPAVPTQTTGADPLSQKQWGMLDNKVQDAWKITTGNPNLIVAVIDTGVDYTHPDLLPNMWRNSGETGKDSQGKAKETNGIDDDKNGFVDDVVGYDFVSNDGLPYDLAATTSSEVLFKGLNPGHGTHCAGNVAAKANNGIGINGVAPDVKIMAVRFLSEKGSGTTADAIKAVKYALDNGAKVLSNSWGSDGEDPNEAEENKALQDVIKLANDKGVLFIAAAGNSSTDNDNSDKKSVPASYPFENIISVAAIDINDGLASFSGYGATSVDIGAPGVKIFSTVPGNRYQDAIAAGLANWDGTSMATPIVAGAAALYWSAYPNKTMAEVKKAILDSGTKINSMTGKSVSGAKLNVKALLDYK